MKQLNLLPMPTLVKTLRPNMTVNRIDAADRAVHDWYRFVLSFPPHLVRDYLERFGLGTGQTILDPFCGTGTTIVEAKLHGLCAIGIEANTLAHFASSVKTTWGIDPDGLAGHASAIAATTHRRLDNWGDAPLRALAEEPHALLLRDSISPLPLHKALVLLEQIRAGVSNQFLDHELLALAHVLVADASNLHFGPEVGVRSVKRSDAPVIEAWLETVCQMAADIRQLPQDMPNATVYHADARNMSQLLRPASIDAVFTSPPYPNEKDYTRTTRLESVVLGYVNSKAELRAMKQGLLRSNTRNVYKLDDDDTWVAAHPEVLALSHEIERRRIELGKTSGFERLYARVTRLYFGGMARHLAELRPFLRPGAMLGYVVGDQASFFQVLIRTGELLAGIAQALGYEVVSIDLFRTRLATATGQQMREEVVVLRWPARGTHPVRSYGRSQEFSVQSSRARIRRMNGSVT